MNKDFPWGLALLMLFMAVFLAAIFYFAIHQGDDCKKHGGQMIRTTDGYVCVKVELL